MDRKYIQDVFIRICRDSGFTIDYIDAAKLTGKVLKIPPFEVWEAMYIGDLQRMERIAKGEHPVCVR